MTEEQRKARIRELNDELRTGAQPLNGKVIVTGRLAQMDANLQYMVARNAARFNAFSEDNDPHGEHDCAVFEVGDRFMFKIDYYALDEETLSEHPEDPNVTIRVMSLFYADDY
jgi:hypothetical protein